MLHGHALVAAPAVVLVPPLLQRHQAVAALHLAGDAGDALGDQVDDLAHVEHDAEGRRAHHEVREDLLLRGVADVAVDQVGARLDVALDQLGQVEAVVDHVQQVEEGDLDARLEEEAQQVGPPQAPVLLPRVAVELGVPPVLGVVLAFAVVAVRHVHHHHEGRAGDEDELQRPQADVGDGEEVVVAGVGAAGLFGVTVKVLLLVAPDPLRSHHVDQNPKHEHHREPDPPERCRVLVHSAKERLEHLPIHPGSFRCTPPPPPQTALPEDLLSLASACFTQVSLSKPGITQKSQNKKG